MADGRLENLRSHMLGKDGLEEKVEVNQRHLIDKILARYSAEYVLYRELMQNADDASSNAVEIVFRSVGSQSPNYDRKAPPNLSQKCDRITFKNNGIPFRPEDWTRLKRIAEGNPDEQKIGAFGVGFYSLFSVCENPFVSSGSQCMGFYFKGDQLFAKRAPVPEADIDSWTYFLMDLREPMEMPDFDDFAQFLTTSMGFTANLRGITVYFDHHKLFTVHKHMAEQKPIAVDAKRIQTVSPHGLFTIKDVSMRQIQLNTEKYTPPSMFAPLAAMISSRSSQIDHSSGLPMEKSSIFLRVVTGVISVSVQRAFEQEMERATKKKPPKTTTFQLVYTGREELEASENNNNVFKNLIPFPHQGRVFIGFPTHQTTGCCSHMAARFIPTVERESIDFADRYISVWNKELLAVGGTLCRIVYNNEMEQIHRLYRELIGHQDLVDLTKESNDDAKVMLEKKAAHALQSFTFKHSTPSSIVGKVQETMFFTGCKMTLNIMTSHGVLPITSARIMPNERQDLVKVFLKTIPIIPSVIMEEHKDSVDKLKAMGIISTLGVEDVLKELDARSFSEEEMVACMKWWVDACAGRLSIPPPDVQMRRRFLGSAIIQTSQDEIRALSDVSWWINPKVIPLDMPIPENTLPFSVSKSFTAPDLTTYFGDWAELTLLEWVRFISTNKELETSPDFAERVFGVISRGYQLIPSRSQAELCALLKNKTCIPTKMGMKLPRNAYFPKVKLFEDLPIVEFKNARAMNDKLLSGLGVRNHVDLQLVFDRLISDGSWSHIDLVKYLASEEESLTELEVKRLRETPIFTKEGEEPRLKEILKPTGKTDANGNPIVEKIQKKIYRRYKASELYPPSAVLRNLQLPIISWDNRWRSTSPEAKFLTRLGLVSTPSLSKILKLASIETENKQLRRLALAYLVENYQEYASQYNISKIDTAFLPCDDGKKYSSPANCFTNPDVRILGFDVLHQELIPVRDKLGIRENPDADQLVDAFLRTIEKQQDQAKRIFEYMASRMSDLKSRHWEKLRSARIVPVQDTKSNTLVLVHPHQCYFENQESSYKELFLYVDFGTLANSFLRSCGVKDEPTTAELAHMVVKDPTRFWDLCGGGERYLSVLRQIAGQYQQIRHDTRLIREMKTAPFLIGIKRSPMAKMEEAAEHSGATEDFVHYQLGKANEIYIVDDTVAQRIFLPLSAPMEPLLEEFYVNLGSERLSKHVKETYTFREVMGVTDRSKSITDAIFERTPIIIYQMIGDNPQRQKELLHNERYVKQNLKVVQVKELNITRKFKDETNVQPTTACGDKSRFAIYVSSVGEIDYGDIANALCRLLFSHVRLNDVIITEWYLTGSLASLQRKGVPVDRILNARKKAEESKKAKSPIMPPTPHQRPDAVVPTLTPKQMDECTRQVLDIFGDCQEGYVRQLLSQERENHVERVVARLLQEDYPRQEVSVNTPQTKDMDRSKDTDRSVEDAKAPVSIFDRFRSWRTAKTPTPTDTPVDSPQSHTPEPPSASEKEKEELADATKTITPNYMSKVRQNLKRGIHSCKPYSGTQLYSPPRINTVAETRSYCDVTPENDLVYVGQAKGMEFYVHRGIKVEQVMSKFGDGMGRFTHVVLILAKVFDLKPSSLHIFYDQEGSTIAFNKGGSLFLNLRFYLALHEPSTMDDQTLVYAKRKEALIYWFMTICHELAHNFVSEHNSEHEFYMSSFAEVYLEALIPHFNDPSSSSPL